MTYDHFALSSLYWYSHLLENWHGWHGFWSSSTIKYWYLQIWNLITLNDHRICWVTCFSYFDEEHQGGGIMKCPHCLGFMVIDTCLNMEGDHNKVWIHEWRCLNCGEIFDSRTLENRVSQHLTAHLRHRRKAGLRLVSWSESTMNTFGVAFSPMHGWADRLT